MFFTIGLLFGYQVIQLACSDHKAIKPLTQTLSLLLDHSTRHLMVIKGTNGLYDFVFMRRR